MPMSVRPLHQMFVAEIDGADLRKPLESEEVATIAAVLDQFPVLVFPGQAITDEQQMAFGVNFGELQRAVEYQTGRGEHRLNAAMTDASNLSKGNDAFGAGDRRRMNNLGSRRWHTDGSFSRIPVMFSILSGRAVPGQGGDTQFADMRAAYDALPEDMKARIDGLVAIHNLVHSRSVVGFKEHTEQEIAKLQPMPQRLVRRHPKTGRKSLYLSSHAWHIKDWPMPEGLDLLYELSDFATQPQFVYSHKWKLNDLVMWDCRVTMHRARRHTPETDPRDMRRVSVLDVAPTLEQAA